MNETKQYDNLSEHPSDKSVGKAIAKDPLALLVPSKDVYLYDPPTPGDLAFRFRWIILLALAVVFAISIIPARNHFSSPEAWQTTIETIDTKKTNVEAMIAGATAASAGISAIPGDAGSPIAEQLMDLAANLTLVLGVLFLEKYLLTILAALSFTVLIPAACVLLATAVFNCRNSLSITLTKLGVKLLLLSIALVLTVPTSTWISDTIDQTYNNSLAEQVEEPEIQKSEEDGKDKNLWDHIVDVFDSAKDKVTSVTDDVIQSVNNMFEGFAVMVVTSCAIPILVLLFYLWMAKILLGVDISAPMNALHNRASTMKPKTTKQAKQAADFKAE